jgi:hypothetical protein
MKSRSRVYMYLSLEYKLSASPEKKYKLWGILFILPKMKRESESRGTYSRKREGGYVFC